MLPRSLLAALVALAALPAAAHAAGHTTITTPAGGTLVDLGSTGKAVAVSGTAEAPVSSVDVVCLQSAEPGAPSWNSLTGGANKPVTAGAFAATVTLGPGQGFCRLIAIPAGTTPTDVSPYAGPLLRLRALMPGTLGSGPNAAAVLDVAAHAVEPGAGAAFNAATFCGLSSLELTEPSQARVHTVFTCAGAVARTAAGSAASALTVDGHPAYGSLGFVFGAMANGYASAADLPGLPTVSGTLVTPADGTARLDEHDAIARCLPGDDSPPSASSCSALADAGVALSQTSTVARDARVVRQVQRWSSTDGRAHALSFDVTVGTGMIAREWSFAGGPWATHAGGDAVDVPAGPAAAEIRAAGAADDDPSGRGATAWVRPPESISFESPTIMRLRYALTVPASGVVALAFVHSADWTIADLAADRAAGEAGFGPSVAIDAPGDGATVAAGTVTVTGTATDSEGRAGVTVDGVDAAVGDDGRWSARVPVAAGDHGLDVVATDVFGLTARASRTVRAVSPVAPPVAPPGGGGGVPKAPSRSTPAPLPSASKVIVLPAARRCVSRRRLTLHLKAPKNTKIAAVAVTVAGRTTKPKLRGSAPIVLKGLPKGRYKVTVKVRFADGRTLTLARTYKTCAPKKATKKR
ncbi:MAG TPA: Ig-like domain-containing protein [Baekduia sp.]|uniref:Ig-like domain-containing protein n=1 Tax=Baekduia sp. TaxID=2600305 RepID=UPI002D78053F|nr:Ig-like domain-containing protein [Baekduia sp.]HET6510428.1 Ig-like domain-containing protein [Baekduia sp.]